MPKIKIMIFDLDGTLMNAYPAVYRSINHVMKTFGRPALSHTLIKRTVGWGDRHLLKTLFGEKDLERAVHVYRKHHAHALCQDTKLLPGALTLLKFLKARGYQLAVASNRPTRYSQIAIRYLGIETFFDLVLCGDKVARPKPAPDILKTILKKQKFSAAEALYVGDMQIDVLTGQRAKVKTIAVATGSHTKAELASLSPWALIDRLSQVKQVLLDF